MPFNYHHKLIKYLGINLPKVAKHLFSESIRNCWKKLKMTQMERYIMLLDWKNQFCQNDYSTPGNLEIQCNSYQITKGIHHRSRTKILKLFMETQNAQIAKAILRRKNGAGGITLQLQTILKSNYQNSIILAQNRNIDQWNRTKSLEINTHTYRWQTGTWKNAQLH